MNTTILYYKFYTLEESGELTCDFSGFHSDDINFNTFNTDIQYSWEFTPGSFLSLVWKNDIFTSNPDAYKKFTENLNNTLTASKTNTLSVKILVYLDYLYLQKT